LKPRGIVFRVAAMSRFLWSVLLFPVALSAASLDERMAEARDAYQRKDTARALEIAETAVKEFPKESGSWFFRGQILIALGRIDRAVGDFDRALALDPLHLFAWHERGAAHFRLGRFGLAIKDWNEVIRLDPSREPYHWQRGIAFYYAGRFEEGRKQFLLHQKVNPRDVENAVFHFICNARAKGLERARMELIPITGDERVPMAEIHQLFQGKLDADAVLAAARKGDPGSQKRHEFYARYYVGLYFDSIGDAVRAREHIFAAEKLADTAGYMGDCARVHASLLRVKGE
jgi:lipoprotein NlpI